MKMRRYFDSLANLLLLVSSQDMVSPHSQTLVRILSHGGWKILGQEGMPAVSGHRKWVQDARGPQSNCSVPSVLPHVRA